MAQDSKPSTSISLPNPRITAIEDQLTAITNVLQGLPLQPQPAVPQHHNIVRPQVSVTDPNGSEVFSGRPDENFELRVDRFNRLAQANRWTAAQKRQIVPSFFRGYAETAYNSIPLDTRTDDQFTYDVLVDRMRRRFVPEGSAELHGQTLHNRRQQPGESVTSYAIEIQRLASLTNPDVDPDTLDSIIRRIFLAGLLEHLWIKVSSRNPTTFPMAEMLARQAEAQ